MSAQVRVDISVSLDGYVAGPDDGPEQPLGRGGEALHEWVIATESWRTMHGYEGGTTGVDSEVMAEAAAGVGAIVMGRRMFDLGEPYWGEEPPFHMPVFVVTHEPREAVVRGETTFAFVSSPEGALERAREAAGEDDVSVAGGAQVIGQLLRARLVDRLTLHVVPLLLGGGAALFAGLDPEAVRFEQVRAVAGDGVTHLLLRVV